MTPLKLIIMLLMLSHLGACAVISKTECINSDWKKVGYDVGMQGERDIATAFNKREQICAKHGVAANWKAFEAGYADGIDEYCSTSNAVTLGIRGATHAINSGVCPESQYLGCYQAFNAGYKYHELSEYVRKADYELDRLEGAQRRYRNERSDIKRRLNSDDVSDDQRRKLERRNIVLRRQINNLSSDMRQCRNRLYNYQRAANDYARYLKAEYQSDGYDLILDDY